MISSPRTARLVRGHSAKLRSETKPRTRAWSWFCPHVRLCNAPRPVLREPLPSARPAAAATSDDLAPCPGAGSQLPGARWVTLGHFHQGRDRVWFLLEQTLSSSIFLPCPQYFCQTGHLWTAGRLTHPQDSRSIASHLKLTAPQTVHADGAHWSSHIPVIQEELGW